MNTNTYGDHYDRVVMFIRSFIFVRFVIYVMQRCKFQLWADDICKT